MLVPPTPGGLAPAPRGNPGSPTARGDIAPPHSHSCKRKGEKCNRWSCRFHISCFSHPVSRSASVWSKLTEVFGKNDPSIKDCVETLCFLTLGVTTLVFFLSQVYLKSALYSNKLRCQHTTLQRGKCNKKLFASCRSAVFIISESLVFCTEYEFNLKFQWIFEGTYSVIIIRFILSSNLHFLKYILSIEIRN